MKEAVIEAAARVVVPKQSVATRRDQKWNSDVGVVLRDIDRFATIVPDAGLMLPQAVNPFLRTVHADKRLGMIGVLAVHLNRPHHAIGFGHERLAIGGIVVNGSVRAVNYDSQARG